jgi:hypothetical protein
MVAVPAKSSSVKKRGLSPVPHEAERNNDKAHAGKYTSVGCDTRRSSGMRRDVDAGSSICPNISTSTSTNQMPPTVACLTSATCVEKSCACKNRSACEASHFTKTLSSRNSARFLFRDNRCVYSTARAMVFLGDCYAPRYIRKFYVSDHNTTDTVMSAHMY